MTDCNTGTCDEDLVRPVGGRFSLLIGVDVPLTSLNSGVLLPSSGKIQLTTSAGLLNSVDIFNAPESNGVTGDGRGLR